MEDLKEKLKLHKEWLEDNTKGVRLDLSGANLSGADLSYANLSYANLSGVDLSGANLSGVDLRYANLSGANLRYADLSGVDLSGADFSGADLRYANLRYCIGNNKEIKSLQIGTYLISYTKDILNIGCQSHTLEQWKAFIDTRIANMDSKALEWWKLNKDIIITLVEREQNENNKRNDRSNECL